MSLLRVLLCQVEVSESGWSLVQMSPTECGGSESDHESSTKRRSWSTGAVASWYQRSLDFGRKAILCHIHTDFSIHVN